ncbi:mycofactocin precursor MftA [Thermogemmatispora sp.]|uniref:mycofactocin precursor MftA n=1 Tax=Thermogemmatispora sp. TaxID=1968838 RepID=UPI0035E41FC4
MESLFEHDRWPFQTEQAPGLQEEPVLAFSHEHERSAETAAEREMEPEGEEEEEFEEELIIEDFTIDGICGVY